MRNTVGLALRVLPLAAIFAAPLPLDAAQSPFPDLGGSWSGGGHIKLSGGQSEQLSCKAYYTLKNGGAGLGMAIRCASASYKIELRSTLEYNDGSVSGSWEERTFNASGNLSGRATPGTIKLAFSGNVSGSMNVTYGGGSQRVSISTSGTDLAGVSLTLSKS